MRSTRNRRLEPASWKAPAEVESLEHRSLLACTATTLCGAEVDMLLSAAAAATPSENAIIAVVDRGGHILGVRVEDDVTGLGAGQIAPADTDTLVFAIDGAVAKARTAAFFASNQAPLTSRTIRFISQTTITQREVDSNPNSLDPLMRGPGFVAPIGIGGHFPPGIRFTPQVDLFAIEHTNRDSIVHPGADHIKGTADDILLPSRFNLDPAFIPAGQTIDPPESYGRASGLRPDAQSRGIATLPGGIPIYKDSNGDGVIRPGDELVGGIGVFFPGPNGYASFEQAFGTRLQGVNAALVLESEYMAAVAANSIPGLGVARLRARLDLVGITLDTVGPHGSRGLRTLLRFGRRLGPGVDNGTNQQINSGGATLADGQEVPDGWLVTPHAGGGLTAAEVETIVNQGVTEASRVRAAIRLPLSRTTRMVFSVTDLDGNLLGLYRMSDATFFSIDVAVAKARNVSYYADATPGVLQDADRLDRNGDGVPDLEPGAAFSNRTFRFLALPRFPEGIDGAPPGQFSVLTDAAGCVDLRTGATTCPISASEFDSVMGFDAFNPDSNFRDPGTPANQNGIIFFPGSTPLFRNGVLVGGFGVSGDGVDQDDVVTAFGGKGYLPPSSVTRADEVRVRGVRLPFIKFLRNPEGRS